MIEELCSHGYSVGPGTVYPILHKMESEGYLFLETKNVNGRIRKYYSITGKGLEFLSEAREKLKELVREILPDREG